MNENYAQPALPAGAEDGILRGMYAVRHSRGTEPAPAKAGGGGPENKSRVQLLGSGTILREVLAAAEILETKYGVAADVWSVTSYTELRRDGMDAERWNTLHPLEPQRTSYVEDCLAQTTGPVIAASDYVRALPDLIRTWVPRRYVALGTDGFGRSDTRENLRRFFEVDRSAVVIAALKALADEERVPPSVVQQAIAECGAAAADRNPWD
jgi:pyruvate dehydrogenase E1 component